MSDTTRSLILRHWALANARDWDAFAALCADDLAYEVPQTREFIASGAGYVELFRTWPGDWQARVVQLTCEGDTAACIIDFADADGVVTGISFFEVQGGRITRVTDYWPAPYDPPPRATVHMQRRPA